jgi:hypothetical protein
MECTRENLSLRSLFIYILLTTVSYSVDDESVFQTVETAGPVVGFSFHLVPRLRRSGDMPPLNILFYEVHRDNFTFHFTVIILFISGWNLSA